MCVPPSIGGPQNPPVTPLGQDVGPPVSTRWIPLVPELHRRGWERPPPPQKKKHKFPG